jgi:hypothetical protein
MEQTIRRFTIFCTNNMAACPASFRKGTENSNEVPDKLEVISCVHTLAVALKHHLRGEREWSECTDLEKLFSHLPNVSLPTALLFQIALTY